MRAAHALDRHRANGFGGVNIVDREGYLSDDDVRQSVRAQLLWKPPDNVNATTRHGWQGRRRRPPAETTRNQSLDFTLRADQQCRAKGIPRVQCGTCFTGSISSTLNTEITG